MRTFVGKNQLLKQGLIDTNYYFLAQIGSRLIGILILPVFARLFSIEDFALYDLFILASSLLMLLAGLGMDSGSAVMIAENRSNHQLLRSLLVTTLTINLATTGLFWFIALVVWYFGFTEKFSLFFIHGLFIYTWFYQFSYQIYNFIRWLGNARNAAIVNFFSYLLAIGGGLFYILIGGATLTNYIIGATGGSVIGALLSAYQARKYLRCNFLKPQHFKDLMRLSLPYVPTYLSSYLMQFVDRLLITTFFGLPTLGLYALVNRVGQVVTFGLQTISSGFRPIITANYSTDEGQSLSRKVFNIFWLLSIPVSAISILLAPTIINLFGGVQYEMATSVLPFIILSVWFLGSFFLFGFGYQIRRKTIYVTLITLAVVALVYLLSIVLINFSGMVGIAQATCISAVFGSWIYIFISEKLYRFQYSLRTMVISTFLSLIIAFLFS